MKDNPVVYVVVYEGGHESWPVRVFIQESEAEAWINKEYGKQNYKTYEIQTS